MVLTFVAKPLCSTQAALLLAALQSFECSPCLSPLNNATSLSSHECHTSGDFMQLFSLTARIGSGYPLR